MIAVIHGLTAQIVAAPSLRKTMKLQNTSTQLHVVRALEVLIVAGFAVMCTPSGAAPAMNSPTGAHAMKTAARTPVETRISSLHTRLQITSAQESLWLPVAQIMRDNANTMQTLLHARNDGASHMSATDDLHSYGQIAEAHADGIKKLTPAFESLYNSMSDVQKHNADQIFRSEGHHVGRKS
ncbi:Spy/CpxP family protein refolding chaperone [Pandoraea sp. PE-S2T-3]|uniref:Spy/CpxP family protein refolding chaperone n=1 Tax=Pandoraea sp. PE-S2T-3 TaxID=1986993 RepID=UPI0020CE270C|nr:Spy/CpxP family protein refolding chaperone [Pandoraea sp. PE-S2T-3]